MNQFGPDWAIAYLIAIGLIAFALTIYGMVKDAYTHSAFKPVFNAEPIYGMVKDAYTHSCSIGEFVKVFLAGLLLVGLAVFVITILAHWALYG